MAHQRLSTNRLACAPVKRPVTSPPISCWKRRIAALVSVLAPGGLLVLASNSTKLSSADLDRALATLPGSLREAFVMKHVEGRSYEEMAEIAGVAIGTIKSQVWQARQRVTHEISVSVTGRDRVPTKTASC